MPLLQENPLEVRTAALKRKRRSPVRRRYKGAMALLTLLAVIGKAILADTQAFQAMLEMWRHLQHIGF